MATKKTPSKKTAAKKTAKKTKKTSINIDLLAKICDISGAPGNEFRVREFVMKEIKGLVDSMDVDPMGNLIALKKGRSSKQKIMAAAHMDEIGFAVQHVDDKGFIRIAPLGGYDPKTLTAQRVWIQTEKGPLLGVMGVKPKHAMSAAESKKMPEVKDYYIDTGLPADAVKKQVKVGQFISRDRELAELGDCVTVKSLDNRVSVFLLIETLRALKKKPAYDFYATFTVQEEVGLRGAQVAAQRVQPDYAFGLDVTAANDIPGVSPQEICSTIGNGAAIKILDSSAICDTRMIKFMEKTAERHKISYQHELLQGGGTDTAMLQRMGQGAIAGAVSIPTRYLHTTVETAHKQDIADCINLLVHCVEDMDKFDPKWS